MSILESAIRNPQSGDLYSARRESASAASYSALRIPYSSGLHRFACFTACSVFFLIIAGGLVTSNDAGLAVPDWPLSYGRLMPPMVGGIFYEHGHRMVATFVGMLTVILAIWIAAREPRPQVRRLGWLNLIAVVAQGLLGGITVLYFLPAPISMAHASLAQAFFCLTVTLAVVTGRKWIEQQAEVKPVDHPSLRALSLWLVASIYVQLILGAGNRHHAIGVFSHIVGALVVLVLAAWLAVRATRYYSNEWAHQSVMLAVLVVGQVLLGVATLLVKLANLEAPQPTAPRVWSATSHVALGALILATSLIFALRVHRRYARDRSRPAGNIEVERRRSNAEGRTLAGCEVGPSTLDFPRQWRTPDA